MVDLNFPLRRYLGGSEQCATFWTQYGYPDRCDAAIKLVIETPGSELGLEWERAAQLSHPNLLRILHSGRWQYNHVTLRYVLTEYAEESLSAVLAERPLAPSEMREMLGPLLEALAYIHGEGLVHGHIKPSNILASGDQLRLSVDGISLVGEPGATPVEPGPYDPPEFRERGCSPLGDVWSLGMTLVEALTLQLPAIMGPKQDPVLPPNVPDDFLPIVRACLRPDLRRRASVEAILTQFRAEASRTIQMQSAGPPAARRKPVNVALVGASALVLGGILLVASMRRPAAPAPTVHRAVESAPVAAPKPDSNASPGVIRKVLPNVPEQEKKGIHGKVRVQIRASVNPSGHVTMAETESRGSRYFGDLALQAARQWDFEPTHAASEWRLRFEFTSAGITVHPSRITR